MIHRAALPRIVVYRVGGRSMEPIIREGDIICVDPARISPVLEDVVVIHVAGSRPIVGFWMTRDFACLGKANPAFEPVILDSLGPWEVVGTVIGVVNKLAAYQAEETLDEPPRPSDDRKIEDVLTLSARAEGRLRFGGISTMGDLARRSARDLAMIKGLGEKTLREIVDAAAQVGLVIPERWGSSVRHGSPSDADHPRQVNALKEPGTFPNHRQARGEGKEDMGQSEIEIRDPDDELVTHAPSRVHLERMTPDRWWLEISTEHETVYVELQIVMSRYGTYGYVIHSSMERVAPGVSGSGSESDANGHVAVDVVSDRREEARDERERQLLTAIKENLPSLQRLLREVQSESEDLVYRFYHHSHKVYAAELFTERIVKELKELLPGVGLNEDFLSIERLGTGKKWDIRVNAVWSSTTRPLLEAFVHARYFLEMAVKYGLELNQPPLPLPSGWAALLYLFNIR